MKEKLDNSTKTILISDPMKSEGVKTIVSNQALCHLLIELIDENTRSQLLNA